MELIDEIAVMFLYMEEVHTKYDPGSVKFAADLSNHFNKPIAVGDLLDFESLDDCRDWWEWLVGMLDDEPWKDGKHLGDCTKVAATCFRCIAEQYRGYAQQWLDDWTGKRELFRPIDYTSPLPRPNTPPENRPAVETVRGSGGSE